MKCRLATMAREVSGRYIVGCFWHLAAKNRMRWEGDWVEESEEVGLECLVGDAVL